VPRPLSRCPLPRSIDAGRWTKEELAFHFTSAEVTKNPLFPCLSEVLASGLAELFATGSYKGGGIRFGLEGHTTLPAAIEARLMAEQDGILHPAGERTGAKEAGV
jgi:hypothetical protein